MINKAIQFVRRQQTFSRVNVALSRAATTSNLRNLVDSSPITWEFSGFSQNGEDGINDYLTQKIMTPNRYFIEIGAADGLENNTSWFAIAKKYSGVMIEGDDRLSLRLAQTMACFNMGVDVKQSFVTLKTIPKLLAQFQTLNPDLFSIDIDGNDYHILKKMLDEGFQPKIIAVEYNSAFGPEKACTIPYQEKFYYRDAHPTGLYYGVSLQAWKNLLLSRDYTFVTVDSRGVNAFFIHRRYFQSTFIDSLHPLQFVENFYQFKQYGTWENQFQHIEKLPTEEISA